MQPPAAEPGHLARREQPGHRAGPGAEHPAGQVGLQAIARVNRAAHGKNAGYVVDYYAVAENLKVALAAYAAEDVEGAMTSIADQVPLLAERRQRVRNLFEARGVERFDTQAGQDACVEEKALVPIRKDERSPEQ